MVDSRAFAQQRKNSVRLQGFTLIELLVVLVIMAILLSIAVPGYQTYVDRTRRADAQAALVLLSGAMERFYTENNSYLGAANGGGNTGAPGIFNTTVPLDGGTANYNLTINAATATTFTLRATPVGVQDGDGLLEYTNAGVRRWDKNDDGDTGDAGEDNWSR
ncbi:MAG: type IV pilin protein [Gammaproteobacteria bacterium]|nr:type IV pilin protein [Gammaproteobacteria bacterium]